MRSTPVLAALLAAAALALAVPAEAQYRYRTETGELRFRVGLFEPEGDSQYWEEKFVDFTGSTSDFEDLTFGIDYQWRMGPSSSIMFGGAWYEGSSTNAYRDWVDADGNAIRHLTELQTWELTVAWVASLGQPRSAIRPYLGVGGGLLGWELIEVGDFIDFGSDDLPIVRTGYRSDGTTYLLFAVAGLDFRLGPGWSFFAEARWRDADDTLGDDLADLGKLDLSGLEYSGGLSFRF